MLIGIMEWLEAAGIIVGIVYGGCILWFTTILEEADAIYYCAAFSQVLAENGWMGVPTGTPEGAGIMMVFDRHREFEQFDHLRGVASSRNSMPKSVWQIKICDKFL